MIAHADSIVAVDGKVPPHDQYKCGLGREGMAPSPIGWAGLPEVDDNDQGFATRPVATTGHPRRSDGGRSMS